MAKIVKQKYTKADGTREIYSYLVPVKKSIMEKAGIDINKEIKIVIENKKIIISN